MSDSEAMETARRLAKEEGLFCGFSAGANVAAGSILKVVNLFIALRLLKKELKGKTIVCVLCDSGSFHTLCNP